MAWLEAASAAITAAELASKAAEKSGLVAKNFARIMYWLKNGKTVLPVFGAGGVGKSTIGTLILDESHRVHGKYDESLRVEELDLDKTIPARILVAPGQSGRVDYHWPALFAAILKGEAVGIINVVAYGYHSLGIQHMAEHSEFRPGDTTESFVARYADKRREEEIILLDRLLSALQTNKNRLWMITVVNKQDLWFHDRAAVKAHYENGRYAQLVAEFAARQGGMSFQHDFVPASLTMQNLMTPSMEMLKATAEGYDLGHHHASLGFLLNTLGDALEAGKSKK